jgi:outer membrane protein
VELDSLNEKISFIKEKRKELESEQRAIETEWENGYRGLDNQKNTFLRKGDAITQQMAEEFQNDLIQQQQSIDQKKQGLTQKLSEKSYKFMESIQKDLKDFLIDYNKTKNYQYILTTSTGDYMVFKDSTLNITADVVNGMNEKIKKENK